MDSKSSSVINYSDRPNFLSEDVMYMRKALCVLVLILGLSSSLLAQTPAVWKELFPLGLINSDGKSVSLETLSGKYVGIYFAGQWCSGCRAFSPQLVPFRNNHVDQFEVVYVSSDKNKAAQFAYMKEVGMPWPTLEFRSAPALSLKSRFEVTSIPTLIVLSPAGELITRDGRADVQNSPADAMAKWRGTSPSPLPYSFAASSNAGGSGRLAYLDRQVIDEVNTLRAIPKQGWIQGTVGGKEYFVAFDRTAWTIKGNVGDKPIDIKIDHDKKKIQGYTHDSGVDLTFTWSTEEYGLEGDVYGYPYWLTINWPSKNAMGGLSCSMLEFNWDMDAGVITGFLADRKADLKYDKVSGRLTGDFFNRKLDLQITNLDLHDFIQHAYLFLK